MPEPLDVYVDTYQVSTNPWAGTINFSVSPAMPAAPGVPPRAENLVNLRLSLENIKLLAFFLRRQILQHEQNLGVDIQVPQQVLNQLQIGAEDWRSFWGRSGDTR